MSASLPAPATTVHLSVRGRVQGVGYRAALCATATACGVRGWVRNRRDGSVEAVLCGPAAAVAQVQAWAGRGPPAAQVQRVEARAPDAGELAAAGPGFAQRPTA